MSRFKDTIVPVIVLRNLNRLERFKMRRSVFSKNLIYMLLFWLFIFRADFELMQSFPPLKYVFGIILLALLSMFFIVLTWGTVIIVTEHRKQKIIDTRRFF